MIAFPFGIHCFIRMAASLLVCYRLYTLLLRHTRYYFFAQAGGSSCNDLSVREN